MNKQALAFLTMFSLILMLSVYYVTLPNDNMSVMTQDGKAQSEAMMEEENKEENKENTKETEEKNTDEVLALQEEIEKKRMKKSTSRKLSFQKTIHQARTSKMQ